ncbi:MAG: DNA recombination protein RmuC [Planctomycetes bacterium]|nr:DNA recombination protein RmuC [Planctomycetota bacterium]
MLTTILTITAALLVLVVIVLVICLMISTAQSRRDIAAQSASITMLARQLEAVKGSQDEIGQTVEKNLQSGQKDIGQYIRSSQDTLTKLHKQLGELQGSSQQMISVGTDVRKLQDILKSPKLRGQLGERSLENLLKDILPTDSYEFQHHFKNGKIVDAIAKLVDYSVPIDAKFPLPAFEVLTAASDDTERTKLRTQFHRDVTKHIDKIAANYINPEEGTLDFALMYIPAENIYYETVIRYDTDKIDILQYALEKKVIPVSPNLLYVYLMTVVMGLHGMQIEKQAGEIRQNLRTLTSDFTDFGNTWSVLGKHIKNTYGQYDEGQRKLDKFTMELNNIQQTEKE